MTITFPSSAETRVIINEIRDVIGRPVTIYTELKVPCVASGCSLNPVTLTSTNPFCLTCSGIGFVITNSGLTVNGHVTWKPSEILNWQTGGQSFIGDCLVQIEYTSEIANLVKYCKYMEVDNKRMELKSITMRGAPSVNRLLISLLEDE